MKCVCRFAVCAVGAVAVAAVVWGVSYGFGAFAVAPKPPAKKAVEIDVSALVQPAAPAATQAATTASAESAHNMAGHSMGPASISGMLASADAAAGEKYAKVCATCHTFKKGEPAKIGPNLYEIVGAPHAHMAGFAYSAGMKAMAAEGGTWTYEELNMFLYKPAAHVPGTKMTFAGIKSDADRANVIAWLRGLADQPQPLPVAK